MRKEKTIMNKDERVKLVGSLMLRLRMERERIKGSGDDSFRNGQLIGLETAEDIVRAVFNIPPEGER